MFGKEIEGVEVYQVGKLQLWTWCSWSRHGYDYARSFGNYTLYCNAESLAKGKYVVLEGTVEFGRIWSKPWVVASFGSLKNAVAAVKDYQEYEHYKLGFQHSLSGNAYTHFYEIWQICDDDELWTSWIYESALSLEVTDEDFDELADDAYPFGDCWDASIDACTPSDVCCCETSGCASKVVKVSKNPRYYYAAIHKYGVEFSNDVTALVRFPSRYQRDKYVYDTDEHWEGRKRESVTRDYARSIVPQAFANTSVVIVDCETGSDEMIYHYATRLHAQGYDAWVRLPDGSQCFVCL